MSLLSPSIFKAYDIRGIIGKTLDADASNLDLDLVNRSVSFTVTTPFVAKLSDVSLNNASSGSIRIDSMGQVALPFGKAEASLSFADASERWRCSSCCSFR